MAGKLVQVATSTVTSSTASVTLTGINSDDVYMLAMNNVQPVNDSGYLLMRVTESGTANTTSNYDSAMKNLRADTSFSNSNYANISFFYTVNNTLGTQTSEQLNGIKYIYNANSSSEYTFFTNEVSTLSNTSNLWGNQGGEVFTSASSVDGVYFFMDNGNIASGTFTLYKVV